ncbi:unnamed protein product [Paramecium octaurelia]|uniref:C3H1-type domain-containing protein n=1 Tax=Paramecium octaurelia TaxID=43137 RepID=A0A8S1UNV1_PAROT|nr:unnamed protein product [Paramecium octaurelia]
MHNAVITIPQHGNGRLYKTSICRHFELGNCSIGEKCQFAHGQKELRNPNDPILGKIPTIDSNIVITNYKTVLCKYDQQGFCKNGVNCPYAHGTNEKKQARLAPVQLKQMQENKENGDDENVVKFLNQLTDKLMKTDAFKNDKQVLVQLKQTQVMIEEKHHRDAAEQLSLVLSSPSRSSKQQKAYETVYKSLTLN